MSTPWSVSLKLLEILQKITCSNYVKKLVFKVTQVSCIWRNEASKIKVSSSSVIRCQKEGRKAFLQLLFCCLEVRVHIFCHVLHSNCIQTFIIITQNTGEREIPRKSILASAMDWLSSSLEMSLFNVKSGFLGVYKYSYIVFGNTCSHFLGVCWYYFLSILSIQPYLSPAEAIVRGFKQGLLTSADYNNLSQCETLDDVKLYMVS